MIALTLALLSGCPHPTPIADPSRAESFALEPAAIAALEAGAADLDVSVRRRAVAALIRIDPLPGGGSWPGRARFDPSEYVRRSAAEALGSRIGEPETRASLRAWVADADLDPWSRGGAALALTGPDVPAAERTADRALLVATAASVTGNRSVALLLAAARIQAAIPGDDERAAEARLKKILHSGNVPSDLWFLRELGKSALPGLRGFDLERVEPELRISAAIALFELGDPAGRTALAERLAADEDAALEVLEGLLDSSIPPADPLLSHASVGVGGEVERLVRYARGGGDVRDVLRGLASADLDVQTFAARAAGARLSADPKTDQAGALWAALRALLPEARPAVQAAAIAALGRSTASPDRAALIALLDDESSGVRVNAAVALATRTVRVGAGVEK